MTDIILIGGKAQNGKDTLAGYLKEEFERAGKKVLIIHFADYLKFMCKTYFGWDGNKDEKGRQILQYVGTDIVRNRQPDFWINSAESLVSLLTKDYDVFIIPDTRFKNELSFGKKRKRWKVRSIRVTRLNFQTPLTEEQQKHLSETDLDNEEFDNYAVAETLKHLREFAEAFRDYYY